MIDLGKTAAEYKNDIIGFAEDILDMQSLEDYQVSVLLAIEKNKRIVISACHDVGKTFLMSIVLLWYIYTHSPCTVITTAPTYGMVRDLLWREIRKQFKKKIVISAEDYWKLVSKLMRNGSPLEFPLKKSLKSCRAFRGFTINTY